jgi:hypothetical protein
LTSIMIPSYKSSYAACSWDIIADRIWIGDCGGGGTQSY